MNRDQRILFPINTANPQINYEVPFGTIEAGNSEPFCFIKKGMFRINTDDIPQHPREVQNWIYAEGDDLGITIGTSVGACAFRDFGPDEVSYPVISPVLLANTTGKQGNLIQTGDFRFDFSITSHESGWENGYKRGIQSQVPLVAVLNRDHSLSAELPTLKSYLDISPGNYLLSTVKKAEGSENIVLRFYEAEGMTANAEISLNFHAGEAYLTNMIEEKKGSLELRKNKVIIPTGRYSVETVMLVDVSDKN